MFSRRKLFFTHLNAISFSKWNNYFILTRKFPISEMSMQSKQDLIQWLLQSRVLIVPIMWGCFANKRRSHLLILFVPFVTATVDVRRNSSWLYFVFFSSLLFALFNKSQWLQELFLFLFLFLFCYCAILIFINSTFAWTGNIEPQKLNK